MEVIVGTGLWSDVLFLCHDKLDEQAALSPLLLWWRRKLHLNGPKQPQPCLGYSCSAVLCYAQLHFTKYPTSTAILSYTWLHFEKFYDQILADFPQQLFFWPDNHKFLPLWITLRTHNCSHLIPLSNKNIFYRVRCVTMWNILWGRIVFMYIVCTVYLTCPLLNSTIAKYVPLILYHSCRFHVDKTHSLRCFPLLTLYWGKTILLFSFRCLHCDGCKRWVAADGCYLWRADVDECWEESPPWRKRRSRICSITSTKSTSMEN